MIFEYIYYLMVICILTSYAGAIDGLEVISKNDIGGYASQQADPCFSYTVIDEPTRHPDYGKGLDCDRDTLAKGWYRFVGSGGNIIPTSCVELYSCNTNGGLWMNGELPGLGEGEVTRTTCSTYPDCASGSCYSDWDQLLSDMKVKKCEGGYYVYYLTAPTSCYFRYCTVVDPCTSHLCQNGECVPKSSTTYECLCDGCWSGDFCDTLLDPCASNNCHNDAHCVATSCSEYECLCGGCWSGEFCTTPLNSCSSNPCPDRAKCFNKSGEEYLCVCEDGWSGEDCNTATT